MKVPFVWFVPALSPTCSSEDPLSRDAVLGAITGFIAMSRSWILGTSEESGINASVGVTEGVWVREVS